MNTISVDQNIYRAAFRATGIFIVLGVLSLFFPLYPPAGTVQSKALWIVENNDIYIIGWGIQIVLMVFFAMALAGASGLFFRDKPFRAATVVFTVFLSIAAFIIPKFYAVWSIPQIADVITLEKQTSQIEVQMLTLLETSEVPYSMFTTYDYLGFLAYAVVTLLIAGPLFKAGEVSAKIAAVFLGSYGVIFCSCMVLTMFKLAKDLPMHLVSENLSVLLAAGAIALFPFYRHRKSIA